MLFLTLPGPSGTTIEFVEPTEFKLRDATIGDVVSRLFPLILAVAGLILFVMLLWGGYNLMFSGGDPQKAQSAKQKVTAAIIGFVIVFTAFFVTQAVNFLFGIDGN